MQRVSFKIYQNKSSKSSDKDVDDIAPRPGPITLRNSATRSANSRAMLPLPLEYLDELCDRDAADRIELARTATKSASSWYIGDDDVIESKESPSLLRRVEAKADNRVL